jgi:hypothetical protein
MDTFKLEVDGVYLNEEGAEIKIVSSIKMSDDRILYLSDKDVFYYENGIYQAEWLPGGNIIGHNDHHTRIKLANIEAKKTFSNSRITAPLAFEILSVWGEKVFGPVEPSRIVERAQEEMNELKEKVVEGWTDQAVEEAADVVVILTRAPGLWNAIVRKMNINFAREWDIKGDGTGYHIPNVMEG